MDEIDAKMTRIMARLAAERERRAAAAAAPVLQVPQVPLPARGEGDCPACEARLERAAILEFDAELAREEADRLAREAHPCRH